MCGTSPGLLGTAYHVNSTDVMKGADALWVLQIIYV